MKLFNPEKFLILVVDDVSKNLEILSRSLERVGYSTTFASSGMQAIARAKNARPDLILLDLMMPEMDGLEVCKILKSDPKLQDIPVIFLTASHEEENLLEAFDVGAVDYVTKPFNKAELLARVKTHLELKDTKDSLEKALGELVEARDAALEAARIKAQFLANMSHEIRTPMNGMLGMAELLLQTSLSPYQLDCLKTLKTSGDCLLQIINDILDFSKLEAGAMRLDIQPFNLADVIKNLVDLLNTQARNKNIDLNFKIAGNVEYELIGDGMRLRQILTNLVGNAIKFTDRGKVAIAVELMPSVPINLAATFSSFTDAIALRFEVRDTGIGIAPEDTKKLFQSFSQVDASITRQYGGTGLGLAICKELVELMGGEIGCNSVLGEGSTFWFTAIFDRAKERICLLDTPMEEILWQRSARSHSEGEELKPLKILLVEDTPINQKVIFRQLALLGYEAELANDGQEGLEKLVEQDYDLVLMDCHMPILDGYQATEQLRFLETYQQHTVVVGLTANALLGDRQKCLQAGMDDYVSKPVSLEDLSGVLEKWSQLKQQGLMKKRRREPIHYPKQFFTTDAPIDLDRLHNMIGSDMALEASLFQSLLPDIKTYVKECYAALENKEVSVVLHKAHNIKGATANMGIVWIPELAAEIEIQVSENNWERSGMLLIELEEKLTELEEFISKRYSAYF